VLGLVALGGQRPWLLDAAARLGDELTARAESTGHGWSWMAPGQRSMHNPCGYAHGAAGIGHALAELCAATGEHRFGEAALRAFDYERSWLDTATRTWPDLRAVARRAGRDAPVPYSDSWCNGAPGIALSRLRAAQLLPSPVLEHDADIALAASERWVAELLAQAPEDFSLCHGAAGAADVLLFAGNRFEDLAFAVGRHGIELYVDSATARFPCGLAIGETPGLMLGSSGIGMLYLRLFERRVTSPLCVRLTARVPAA
jgi:lantibiotic modifying enzyme